MRVLPASGFIKFFPLGEKKKCAILVSMKSILLSLLVLTITSSNAVETRESRALNSLTVRQDAKNQVPRTTLKIDADSFYDIKFDYDTFSGRVTDRDATS